MWAPDSVALVGLSDLVADLGDLIAELDINPFAVEADGRAALDALVALRRRR